MDDALYIEYMVNFSTLLKQQLKLPEYWCGFTFSRCIKNGNYIMLSTKPESISHYFEHKFYNDSVCHRFANNLDNGIIMHSWYKGSLSQEYSRKDLKYNDGITVVVRKEQYTDFYHLSSNHHEVILSDGLTQEVDSFVLSFHENHKAIVDMAMQYQYFIQLHEVNQFHLKNLDKTLRFMQFMQTGRFYINHQTYLTISEVVVLNMYTNGVIVIDISKQLNVSKETLSSHLKNIKSKFNVPNQNQLFIYELK